MSNGLSGGTAIDFGDSSVEFGKYTSSLNSILTTGSDPTPASLIEHLDETDSRDWWINNSFINTLKNVLSAETNPYQELITNHLPNSEVFKSFKGSSAPNLLRSEDSKRSSDNIWNSFNNRFSKTLVDNLVAGVGIDKEETIFDSNSPLRKDYDAVISTVSNKLKTYFGSLPIEEAQQVATQTENKFINGVKTNLTSFVDSSLQTLYQTYSDLVTGKKVSSSTWDDMFSSEGRLKQIYNNALDEVIEFNNSIIEYLESSVIDSAVDTYEEKQEQKLTADLAKIKSSMASQHGLNESSNMYAEVLLRRNLQTDVARYKSEMQMKMYDFFAQLTMNKEQLRTNMYSNVYQQEVVNSIANFMNLFNSFLQQANASIARQFTYVDSEIARMAQQKGQLQQLISPVLNEYNLKKIDAETRLRVNILQLMLQTIQADKQLNEQQASLLHDLFRTQYQADYDLTKQEADYTIKKTFFGLDARNYAFNALAAAGGAVSSTANPNKPMETVVSTALSGASVGAMSGNPAMIGVGTGIGALGGILSQLEF